MIWLMKLEVEEWEFCDEMKNKMKMIWECCCWEESICCCRGVWWLPFEQQDWWRGKQRPSSPRSQDHTIFCCHEGRTDLRHRTCVHIPDKRNTLDDKHWSWLSSPFQMQELFSYKLSSNQSTQTTWNIDWFIKIIIIN